MSTLLTLLCHLSYSTPNTLSSVMPPELAGAIPLIDKFQVNIQNFLFQRLQ